MSASATRQNHASTIRNDLARSLRNFSDPAPQIESPAIEHEQRDLVFTGSAAGMAGCGGP